MRVHVDPRVFYAFIVIFCTVVNSDRYPDEEPSLKENDSYDTYLLTDPTTDRTNLCRPVRGKPREILLRDRVNSAIIVKSGHKFHRWFNRPDNFTCKFTIKTLQPEKIMAVVQTMSLRLDSQNKCIDYIKFGRGDLTKTERYCGQIDVTHGVTGEYRQISPTGEFDREIETTIFVSRTSQRFSEDPINITITYTAFKKCDGLKLDAYRRMENNTCMAEEYICDGLQNCLPHICSDEKDCPSTASDTGSKVVIGAVTTMFLSFVIFLMGLWLCRKHKKLCWSSDCAGPSVNETFPNVDRETANRVVPSSPMLNPPSAPAVDKDPPPSYNSLFPERTTDS